MRSSLQFVASFAGADAPAKLATNKKPDAEKQITLSKLLHFSLHSGIMQKNIGGTWSMLSKARSCAVIGLEGALVEVEVDIANGLAAFSIVGLPDTAVNEAKDRVRAAIKNTGMLFPFKRITVNLAPADLRKEGPAYDLPIAIALLLASGQINPDEQIEEQLFLGELSLDGSVRHTNGILPMVAVAREKHIKAVFVPAVDAMEATLVQGVTIYP